MGPADPHSAGSVALRTFTLGADTPLELDCGRTLAPVTLAYTMLGALNAERSNAILVCHALSGDAHVAGYLDGEAKPGWWDGMVGPGKAFDTDRYCVICANVIGGCKGSTGPGSLNPDTGRPYALDVPLVTIGDMVRAQKRLIDHLGIARLLAVAGGSMGGMQALEWVAAYPESVASTIVISTALKHSPQQIAFHEVGRQAIMADPDWRGGDYYGATPPEKGLAVARMIGHITYMSEQSMEDKFSRRLKEDALSFSFRSDFEVEGYLRYRGDSFVKRFDANSYLYITKALDYFDRSGNRLIPDARQLDARFLVMTSSSDWLYPAVQTEEILRVLKNHRIDATYYRIETPFGHDAFLLEFEEQTRIIRGFLERTRP